MTRFTLRDVFWLTLVVGMGVGWWLERRDAEEARWVRNEVRKQGARIGRDANGEPVIVWLSIWD
jgi:hypothetical protein